MARRNSRHQRAGQRGRRAAGSAGSAGDGRPAAGAGNADALAQRFFDQPQPRHWASYAPVVLDSRDPAAGPLVSSAARALAALAVTVAERLPSAGSLPVALAGGLIRHPALRAAVRSELARTLPGSAVTVLRQPPVAGAVRLARAAAGA